ncbi:hypothetical protein [thiotrophic endosymbiont of Bathymodiolus puteoserpentis (Logatchev)]|jgi:hypothetical protein|uniref:hypothetical protein n=1 Tax=thiotrophic endosymbiont of Bathymodiolus puteoserpentis (Logatchev) TaxID=343240 RepID=UPI001119224B|nr:hypothetical protein [thiotrophic endosymbiont of Bathymodiolus puteoserpentis (Logatchev)]
MQLLNNILPISFVKIEKGVGSFLTFTTKNEKKTLWIYLSDWIIYKKNKKILDCENKNNIDFLNVLYQIEGKPLIKIKDNSLNEAIDFIFTDGYKLCVYSNLEIYDSKDDLFMFFIENKIISYSTTKGLYIEIR